MWEGLPHALPNAKVGHITKQNMTTFLLNNSFLYWHGGNGKKVSKKEKINGGWEETHQNVSRIVISEW